MNPDVETDLPPIRRIETDAGPGGAPGVRIWLENDTKIQMVEDELGSVEMHWFRPNDLGKPEDTQVVDDATAPDVSLAKVGLETVADYLAFEDEGDARENWGDEHVDILLDK